MKVLIACEFSGVVRDAFRARGHDAMSCDLLPTESPGQHYQGDMFDLDLVSFDLIIAHPPCTALCVSGNRHYAGTKARGDAAEFVRRIWSIPVKKMCIENPVGVINTLLPEMPRPQYIQPWQFGHGETKKTGLWLRGLPPLQPEKVVEGRADRIHKMPPGKDRWKKRSVTYQGIAKAMANQWG
jgi:site-specific DNA-cytosine methylase